DTTLELRLSDHSGVGTLDLTGPAGRLGRWRYTLANQIAALRLLKLFGQRMAGVAKETPEVVETADGDEPADTELQTPPSTWVLLRLGRFAKP
ncbi:ABC transporter, partial [Mycobacterium tuberculosis]